MNHKAMKLESLLAAKLTEFLESEVVYGIRRVLAAEINQLYRGPQEGAKFPSFNFLRTILWPRLLAGSPAVDVAVFVRAVTSSNTA